MEKVASAASVGRLKWAVIVLAAAAVATAAASSTGPSPLAVGKNPALGSSVTTSTQSTTTATSRSCRRPAQNCHRLLPNDTCLGAVLPYDLVSLDLITRPSVWEARAELRRWSVLRAAPQCWSVVAPLLCAVYLPRCAGEKGDVVELPPRHLCRVARGPCGKLAAKLSPEGGGSLPDFLDCENDELFAHGCEEVHARRRPPPTETWSNMNFSSGVCQQPLVASFVTDTAETETFGDFVGCTMRCRGPTYTPEEYDSVRTKIYYGSLIGIFMFSFAAFTCRLSLRKPAESPPLLISQMNYLWLLMMVMAAMQFLKSDLVCRDNDTRRTNVTLKDHPLCWFAAFFLYFAFVALLLTFTTLCYCWQLGDKKTLVKRTNVIRFLPIGIAIFATCVVAFFAQIEADSLTGICHFSSYDPKMGLSLVCVPVLLTIVFADYNFLRFFKRLYSNYQCQKELSMKKREKEDSDTGAGEKRKLRAVLIKTALYVLAVNVTCVYLLVYSVVGVVTRGAFSKALTSYVLCKAKQSVQSREEMSECVVQERPNLLWTDLLLVSLLLAVGSTFWWLVNRNTLRVWREECWSCGSGENNSSVRRPAVHGRHHGKKHELIKEAYARRDEFARSGRLSMSLPSLNVAGDAAGGGPSLFPVDMQFYMNETGATSTSFDTSFAAALPRLMGRRNAIAFDGDDDTALRRQASSRYSLHSISNISVGKHSLDSNLSIQPSELEHLRQFYSSHKRKGKKHSKRNFFNRNSSRLRRRLSLSSRNDSESSVSQISSAFSMTDGAIELKKIRKSDRRKSSSSFSEVKARLALLNTSTESARLENKKYSHSANVQTSMSDLSVAVISPPAMVSIATQYDPPTGISSSNSSSTNQQHHLPLRHLEPNVIRISVPSEDTSSSLERDFQSSTHKLLRLASSIGASGSGGKENNANSSVATTSTTLLSLRPPHLELHNRDRRGAVQVNSFELVGAAGTQERNATQQDASSTTS